jgi:hypothetical protein
MVVRNGAWVELMAAKHGFKMILAFYAAPSKKKTED